MTANLVRPDRTIDAAVFVAAAHASAARIKADNPWMSDAKAFCAAVRLQYKVAMTIKTSFVIRDGVVLACFEPTGGKWG